MNRIEKYLYSKGAFPLESRKKALLDALRNEHGIHLDEGAIDGQPLLMSLKLEQLARDDEQIFSKAPAEPIIPEEDLILGIAILDDGRYTLVDGHRRVHWAYTQDWAEGPFIVISLKSEPVSLYS